MWTAAFKDLTAKVQEHYALRERANGRKTRKKGTMILIPTERDTRRKNALNNLSKRTSRFQVWRTRPSKCFCSLVAVSNNETCEQWDHAYCIPTGVSETEKIKMKIRCRKIDVKQVYCHQMALSGITSRNIGLDYHTSYILILRGQETVGRSYNGRQAPSPFPQSIKVTLCCRYN
jgi:hypothetical protein